MATGPNATITGTTTGSVTEDSNVQNGYLVAAGTLVVTDPNPNEGSFRQETLTGTYGTFQLGTSGNWTYQALDSQAGVQALAQGQQATDSFMVQSFDGTSSQVTITLNGTNDAPVAVASSVIVNQNHSLTGQVTSTDVDTSDTHNYALASQATHGTVVITNAATGAYTYTPTASYTGSDSFTFTSTDNNGAVSAPAAVTVTVTPDHAPVATASTLAATEDTTANGTLSATDSDGDTLTYALNSQAAHGTVVITNAATGAYTYTPTANFNGTDSFTFTANDGTLASTPVTVNVNVAAVNDAPTAQPGTLAATEGTGTVAGFVTATDPDTDPANNATPDKLTYQINTPVAGLIFNSNGSYSLNTNNAAYDHLAAGAHQTITANYSVTDSAGARSNSTLAIDVTGTNDVAVVTGNTTGAITEDATPNTATGTLTVADKDDGQSNFGTATQTLTGTYGSFVLTPGVDAQGNPTSTASYTYTLDNTKTQALGQGDHPVETFTVHTADNTARTVTITVNGANDAPVVSGPVALAGGNVPFGTIDNVNPYFDQGLTGYTADPTVHSSTGAETYGEIGNFPDFYGDNSAVFLYGSSDGSVPAGETESGPILTGQSFHATAGDQITVTYAAYGETDTSVSSATIELVNDDTGVVTTLANPVNPDSIEHTYNGAIAATGNYHFVFETGGQATNAGDGTYYNVNELDIGTASVTSTGSGVSEDAAFTYVNGVQQLIANATDVDTNDAGKLTVAPGTITTTHGATVTIGADGSVTIDATKAADAQALGAGETLADSFSYTVVDAHSGVSNTATASYTLVGFNDAPTVTGNVALTGGNDSTTGTPVFTGVSENTPYTYTDGGAQLVSTAHDVDGNDAGQLHVNAFTGTSTNGAAVTLDANGNLTIDTSNSVQAQALGGGQTLADSFSYTVADGHGGTVAETATFTVIGDNDAPTLAAKTLGTLADTAAADSFAPITGSSTVTDPDQNDTHGFTAAAGVVTTTRTDLTHTVSTTASDYGSFAINAATGDYVFTPNSTAINALHAGDQVSISYDVTTTDSGGLSAHASYTVAITGANDTPVVVSDSNSAVEGGAVINGTVANDTDADGDQLAYTVQTGTGVPAGLTLYSDGSYTFDPTNAAYDSLAQGATTDVVLHYQASDGNGGTGFGTLTVHVTGTEDAPTITSASLGTITDTAAIDTGAAINLSGTIATGDVDLGDTRTVSVIGDGTSPYGTLVITNAATGAFAFTGNQAAINALAATDNPTVTYAVQVADNHGGTAQANLTIALHGANDTPVITSAAQGASLTESDAPLTASGAVTASDAEGGSLASSVTSSAITSSDAQLTAAQQTQLLGDFHYTASTGAWTYDTGTSPDFLPAGSTTTLTYTVGYAEATGANPLGTSQDVVITLHGTNDAPVVTAGAPALQVTEGTGVVTDSVHPTGFPVTDADNGDTLTYAATGTAPAGVTFRADGSYDFDTSNAAYTHIAAGAHQDVVINFTVSDGHGGVTAGTDTVEVTGVENAIGAPAFIGGAPTVAEDSAIGTAVATVNAIDPDDGSHVSYTLTNDAGGRFAVDAASGTITVANGIALDYEQAPLIANSTDHGYGIDILATSADGSTSTLHANVVVTDVANEQVIGTPASETVVGGAGDDSFTMGAGNDTITGGGGHDTINGGDGYDTAVFNFNLNDATIVRTGLYAMTITHGTDVATLTGIEDLKFADGNVNLVSANPLVDNLYYDQHNYDVYLAGLDPTAHYLQYGEKEGRDPDLAFSTKGYLAANPDLSSNINLLTEFTTQGAQQGRDPSAGFDTKLYLLHNPDVAASGMNALAHYVNFGQFEGRATYAAIGNTIMANGFDSEYYLLSNPDVAAAGVDPYQHYLQYGAAEGRNPNAWFDDKGYLAANPDVAAAGANPLIHYDTFGWKEGRDPSAAFDTKAYLAANPDVANAHVDPLVHFLQYGAYELRDPHSDGMIAGTAAHVTP